ncbi:MAG: leucyl aminopeptidase, partial [Alphaproteobacteria bacterium]|nr:leucyl aminopeptidase [Alphaproteobacteria bacterium]
MEITFAEFKEPRSGAVVVGVWEQGALTPAARRLDETTSGVITRALSVAPRFKGKKDELLPIVAPANVPVSRIVLAGLGKPEDANARLFLQLGGHLIAHLNSAGETEATFAVDADDGAVIGQTEAAAQLALGARLRSYRFDKYKTKQKPEQKPSLERLTIATSDPGGAERAYQRRDQEA